MAGTLEKFRSEQNRHCNTHSRGWFGASNLLTCDQHLEQRSARGTSCMSVCVSSSGQAWLTACGASTALLRLGPEFSPEAPGRSAVP